MKRILSLALALVLCLTLLPTTAGAALSAAQIKEFDEFFSAAGVVPDDLRAGLGAPLTVGDLLSFTLQFAKTKCGVDTDSALSRARQSASSEASAVAAALNSVLSDTVWQGTDEQLSLPVTIDDALNIMQRAGLRLLAPLSPCIHQTEYALLSRNDFLNIDTVVYHIDYLRILLGRALSMYNDGQTPALNPNGTLQRRVWASFVYMLCTQSLPKDLSGKYPGGVSGDAWTDTQLAAILDKIITPGMDERAKVKAIYDYMIYHYVHDISDPVWLTTSPLNPLCVEIALASSLLKQGIGVCDDFAGTFKLLAIRLGIECNYVSGQFVNSNGSKTGHGWNQVRIDGVWYWLDVDVEGTSYRRSGAKTPSYYLFLKFDSEWTRNHQWGRGVWPDADGSYHPVTKVTASAFSPSGWARDDVAAAIALGLVPKSLQSNYTNGMTRAEFCALAVALYEKVTGGEITERLTFGDTTDVNVEKAAAIGVVQGIGNNKFDPTAKLTREMAATMLSRLADALGNSLAPNEASFADKGKISAWALDAAGQMQLSGIMGGVGGNLFAPKDSYTREQSIVTVLRLYRTI